MLEQELEPRFSFQGKLNYAMFLDHIHLLKGLLLKLNALCCLELP